MNVAGKIARTLSDLGITRVYGLPGEDHMTLLDEFQRNGLQYHTAVNESSAVIMAAADSLVDGVPGVVVLSLAPGLSNGFNGILHAYMEGAPVLIISGQHAAAKQPLVVRQGFELSSIVGPVTKWAGRLVHDADPALLVAQALDLATAGRPGPVYLEVADEVAIAPAPEPATGDDAVEVLKASWGDSGRGRGPSPDPRLAHELAERLAAARRPVLILGGRAHAVSPELARRFSDHFRCPVLTSSSQKGVLTSAAPYFAGTFLNGSLESEILGKSDLILTIEPQAHDVYNSGWNYPGVTVAISASPLGEWVFTFASRLVADPVELFEELLTAAEPASEWTPDDVRSYRDVVHTALTARADDGFSVSAAIGAALASVPEGGARIVADAGFSKPIIAMLSEPRQPADYLASNALSTMGFSIPAALAAARASERPVLSFMGDGSLLMRVTELVFGHDLVAPLVVVAIVDGALSQIEIKQTRRDLDTVGVQLPQLSCEALAQGVGIRGVDVHSAGELSDALADAWRTGGVTLIGAHVSTASSRRIFEVLRG